MDVLTGPGGAIIGIDYTGNAVKVAQPQGASGGMQAYDIFPWRARPDTSAPFVIGGTGFGSGTSVTIGGLPATITTVTPTRIHACDALMKEGGEIFEGESRRSFACNE